MELGFTKSKVGSNLYFKVECGKPICVDDLIEEDEIIVDKKEEVLKIEIEPPDVSLVWDQL